MQDFVSSHRVSLLVFASMSIVVGALLLPGGFRWPGLACASLALSAAVFLAMRSNRSIYQVIHDVETEPRFAFVVPETVTRPRAEHGSD